MSAKLMGAVFELELDRDEFPVMIALADHAHDDGTSIYPSIGYLAWKCNLSERSVQRILRKLEERELIEVTDRRAGGRSITRAYVIHIEKGVKKSPFSGRKGASVTPPKGDTVTPITDKRVTSTTEKGDIHDIEKGDTGVTPLKRTVSIEPSENLVTGTAVPVRDPIWDTLVEIHGFTPPKKTKEHGRWNAAVGTYRRIGIEPCEIPRVYELYHREYRGMDDNADAVAGRAQHLLSKARQSALAPSNGSKPWVLDDEREDAAS